MSFPNINFKQANVIVDDKLLDLLEEKLSTLEKFVGDWPSVCDVEFERTTRHQQGDVYTVAVNLEINGKLYHASATEANFEKAVDEVRNELEVTLRKAIEKRDTMIKRGGRKLKEMLRFGR